MTVTVSDSPTEMLTIVGWGVTFLPVTVMSILLIAGVDCAGVRAGVEVEADVDVCAGVGDEVDGVVDGVGSVCEQDARTRAVLRPTAAVTYLRSWVVLVTVGSLGRFV